MRCPASAVVSTLLMVSLAAAPVLAQAQPSIRASAEKAATTLAAESSSRDGRGVMFWSGVALGAAGVTAAVLGVTVARVETSSTGNAPPGAYAGCVAQKRDPIYATNNCDALKGKNRPLLWSGIAVGAVGAGLVIGSTRTSAELSTGAVRLIHRIRF